PPSPPTPPSPGRRSTTTLRGADIAGGGSRSGVKGGRVSADDPSLMFAGAFTFLSSLSADEYWHSFTLAPKSFERLSMTKVMELLADFSPDVSRALWDFILLCCPGYEAQALKPGSEDVDE